MIETIVQRLGAKGRSFVRREDGVTVIEFALVAAPFFWLIIALGEIGVMSLAQTNLNLAMSELGRDIRTGEAQAAGMTQAQAQEAVCDNLRDIMPMECPGRLFIDVETFEAFVDIGVNPPVENGQFQAGQMDFDPGVQSEIVLVRGYYRWQVITPFFGSIFSNIGSNERLLSSAFLFRNEPWPEEEA
ncbi:MAG: pilus assembly protein [Alphaproteobacteria bacterium]|nr:pilus assembly protein [Alphaproteobacteria bacterium]